MGPLDLKFVDAVNHVLTAEIWPDSVYVADQYSLIQQIMKCLLTNPGEDSFDPSYGGGLPNAILGIPGQETDVASRVVAACLSKVGQDLASPSNQLIDIRLASLTFDAMNTQWVVTADVITTANSFQFSTAV